MRIVKLHPDIKYPLYSPNKQTGAILILALFIVALVAALATGMALHLHNSIQFNEELLNQQKARMMSQGAVFWAINKLKINPTSTQVSWNVPLNFKTEFENGWKLEAKLEDAQAYLNINSLNQLDFVMIFAQLVHELEPKLSSQQALRLAQAVTNTLNAKPFNNSSTNIWFWHRGELLNIPGIKEDLLAKLKPFLVTLPASTSINVLTAPAIILQSLSPHLTHMQVNNIIAERAQGTDSSINSIDEWIQKNQLQKVKLPTGSLTLKTSFFHLHLEMENSNEKYQRDVYFQRVSPKSGIIYIQILRDQIRHL